MIENIDTKHSGSSRANGTSYKERRVVLSPEQTQVPALAVFGYARGTRAELPVIAHRHREKFEFVLLLQGIQQYTASGVNYTVYAPGAFVTQPGEEHASAENMGGESEMLWFQIDMHPHDEFTQNDFLGLAGKAADELYERLYHFDGRQFELDSKLASQFREAFLQLENGDRLRGQMLFAYCLATLISSDAEVQALSPDIDRAKQYILIHIGEAIDQDELQLASGLSAGELRKKFEAQIGMSPREFINLQKIEHSKQDVARGKKSIAEIAFDYHFSSVNHFKLLFKKTTGVSVSKYRKLALKGKLDSEESPLSR